MDKFRDLFQQKSEIIDLKNVHLTETDLKAVSLELEKNPHVLFINWKSHNEPILNKNASIKSKIQAQLIQNLFTHEAKNKFVIDLSKCEIDADFLNDLAKYIKENSYVGSIFLGAKNEAKFNQNQEPIKSINNHLWKNIEKFSQSPSDYEHALLASHVRNHTDLEALRKPFELGWKIYDQLKVKGHVSVIYLNEKSRRIVMAFKGFTPNIIELISDRKTTGEAYTTLLANEIIEMSYFAYLHARLANELSRRTGYGLSFTGYAFGALLAEQCVYFSHIEWEKNVSGGVRAVTFESPGSFDLIEAFNKIDSMVRIDNPSMQELAKSLDIKTYLLAPNFVNSSNRHLGKVYQIADLTKDENVESRKSKLITNESAQIDQFVERNLIGGLKAARFCDPVKAWIAKANANYTQSRFYMLGIRTLFADKLDWLLNKFDPVSGLLSNEQLFEVVVENSWPKIESRQIVDSLEIQPFDVFMSFISSANISQELKKIVSTPMSQQVDIKVRAAYKNILPNVMASIRIVADMKQGENSQIDWSKQPDWTVLDPNVTSDEAKSQIEISNLFENLVCQMKYHVVKTDTCSDLVNLQIDNHLIELKNQNANYKLSNISPWFSKLTKQFIFDESVMKISTTSKNLEIRALRNIFNLLLQIDGRLCMKQAQATAEITDSSQILDEFGGAQDSEFVQNKEINFEFLDEKFSKSNFLYLHGESGCGKTTFVIQYEYYAKTNEPNLIVQYIKSYSFKSNVDKLARQVLGKTKLNEIDEKRLSTNDLLKLIFERLHERKVLIVVDDVKNHTELGDLLSHLNPSMHRLLVVSQFSSVLSAKLDKTGSFGIKMNMFDIKTAIRYLEKAKLDFNEDDRNAIMQTADKLQRFVPIFLKLSVRLLRTQRDILPGNHLLELVTNQDRLLLKTLENDNKLGYKIMQHAAYLDGQRIDYTFFSKLLNFERNRNNENEKELFNNSINYLVDYKWLKKLEPTKLDSFQDTSYEVHEFVQEMFKRATQTTTRKSICQEIVRTLNASLVEELNRNKFNPKISTFESCRHVERLLEFAREFKENDDFLSLLKNTMCVVVSQLHDVDKAVKFLAFIELYSKSKPSQIANLLIVIANLSLENKRFDDARTHFHAALKKLSNSRIDFIDSLIESFVGRNEMSLSTSSNNPQFFIDLLNSFNSVLSIKVDFTNPDVVVNYHFIKHILNGLCETNRQDSKILAIRLVFLAVAYQKEQNYQKALERYTEALEVYQNFQPNNSEFDAFLLANIGLCYMKLSKYDKSLAKLKESVTIFESLTSSNKSHQQLIELTKALENTGIIHEQRGNYLDAEQFYNRVLELKRNKKICTKLNDSNHLEIARTLDRMGDVNNKLEKLDKAEKFYREALEIRESHLSREENSDIAMSFFHLGYIYHKREDYEQALSSYERAYKLRKQLPLIVFSDLLNSMGVAYQKLGKFVQARDVYIEELDWRRAVLSDEHDKISDLYNNIGIIYLRLECLNESLEYLKKALEIREITKHDDRDGSRKLVETVERILRSKK